MFGVTVKRYDYITLEPDYNKFKYKISLSNLSEKLEKILIDLFGKETLSENLKFIEETLKIKSVKDYYNKQFLEDHEKQYQGHPIYFIK